MRKNLKLLLKDTSGASAIEYALILAILSVGLGSALTPMGSDVTERLFELGWTDEAK